MSSHQLMMLRISKQTRQIQSKPLQNIIVAIKSQRQIHFCIHGLCQPYEGGFYHGVLQLPESYPFSAPKFKFLTNNGRFQSGKYVCTTFTSYHQQAWSSVWTIRTILTAILSFFLSNQIGYGVLEETNSRRQILATKSLDSNLQNQQFCQLFAEKLKIIGTKHLKLQQKLPQIKMQLDASNLSDQIQGNKENMESVMLPESRNVRRNQNNLNKRIIRILYAILISIIIGIVLIKI